MQARIANIRSHIYYNLNCELAPALTSMLEAPWEASAYEPGGLAAQLPPPADTAKLIRVCPRQHCSKRLRLCCSMSSVLTGRQAC